MFYFDRFYTLQTDAAEFKTEFERAQKINAGGAVEQPKVEEAKAEEPASTAEDSVEDKSAEKAEEKAEETEKAQGDQEGEKETA